MEYQIESGIPMPIGRELKSRHHTFPFGQMEVGQSISIGFAEMVAARCAAVHCGKKQNKVFRSRLITTGLRIWRVA